MSKVYTYTVVTEQLIEFHVLFFLSLWTVVGNFAGLFSIVETKPELEGSSGDTQKKVYIKKN